MRRFFYGNVSQNGDDFPTITGSGDAGFNVTVAQLATETEPEVFTNEAGRFFLVSPGNFVEGQCGVVFQPTVGGAGFVNAIFTEPAAYAPDKIAFITTNSEGIAANDQIRNTSFIAWTDVEVEP